MASDHHIECYDMVTFEQQKAHPGLYPGDMLRVTSVGFTDHLKVGGVYKAAGCFFKQGTWFVALEECEHGKKCSNQPKHGHCGGWFPTHFVKLDTQGGE